MVPYTKPPSEQGTSTEMVPYTKLPSEPVASTEMVLPERSSELIIPPRDISSNVIASPIQEMVTPPLEEPLITTSHITTEDLIRKQLLGNNPSLLEEYNHSLQHPNIPSQDAYNQLMLTLGKQPVPLSMQQPSSFNAPEEEKKEEEKKEEEKKEEEKKEVEKKEEEKKEETSTPVIPIEEVGIELRSKLNRIRPPGVFLGKDTLNESVKDLKTTVETLKVEFGQLTIEKEDKDAFTTQLSKVNTEIKTIEDNIQGVYTSIDSSNKEKGVEYYNKYESGLDQLFKEVEQLYKVLTTIKTKLSPSSTDIALKSYIKNITLLKYKQFLSTIAFTSEQVIKDMNTVLQDATIKTEGVTPTYKGKVTGEDMTNSISTATTNVEGLTKQLIQSINRIWEFIKQLPNEPDMSYIPIQKHVVDGINILRLGANLIRNACNKNVNNMYTTLSSTYDYSVENMITLYPKLCTVYDMILYTYKNPGIDYEVKFNELKKEIQLENEISVKEMLDNTPITYNSTFSPLQESTYSEEMQLQLNRHIMIMKEFYDKCVSTLDHMELLKINTEEILEECELSDPLLKRTKVFMNITNQSDYGMTSFFSKTLEENYKTAQAKLFILTDLQESFKDGLQDLLEAMNRYKSNIEVPEVDRGKGPEMKSVPLAYKRAVDQQTHKLTTLINRIRKLKSSLDKLYNALSKQLDKSTTDSQYIKIANRINELCLMDSNDALTITKRYMMKYDVKIPQLLPEYIEEEFDKIV